MTHLTHSYNQASITSTAIKEMPIPNIDISTQKSISNKLDSITNAIQTKQKILLSLDEFVKSRFILQAVA